MIVFNQFIGADIVNILNSCCGAVVSCNDSYIEVQYDNEMTKNTIHTYEFPEAFVQNILATDNMQLMSLIDKIIDNNRCSVCDIYDRKLVKVQNGLICRSCAESTVICSKCHRKVYKKPLPRNIDKYQCNDCISSHISVVNSNKLQNDSIQKKYNDFRIWLIQNGENIDVFPSPLDRVFTMNQILTRYICKDNIFDVIRKGRYDCITAMKNHYRYSKNPDAYEPREEVLSLLFEFLGRDYYAYKNNKYYKTKIKENHIIQTLYVHSGVIKCLKYKHPIENIAALINVSNNHTQKIHATYCKKCNLFFIHKGLYKQLKSAYPKMKDIFFMLDKDGNPIEKSELSQESILRSYGYSVRKDGLDEEERHEILTEILNDGMLSKTEIIQHLEMLLSYNAKKENMKEAAWKWQRDLDFVRNYELELHEEFQVEELENYSNRDK